MNKILAALFFLIICGCATSPIEYGTNLNFNIENGFFEEFQVSTWNTGELICAAVVASSPKFGKNWRPVTGFGFEGEEKGVWHNIELISSSNRDSLNLTSRYNLGNDTKTITSIIKSKIKYGDSIRFKIEIIDSHILKLTSTKLEKIIDLGFKPTKLFVKASSIQSSVSLSEKYCQQ